MIIIKESIIQNTKNENRNVKFPIDIDGRGFELWVESTQKWSDNFVTQRADAPLVAILYYAMRNNYDISCEMPVTSELLHNLEVILIPTIAEQNEDMSEIKILSEVDDDLIKNVGAGFSKESDCFNIIAPSQGLDRNSLRITHLTSFSHGAFGRHYNNRGWKYAAKMLFHREQEVAERPNLPLILVNSSFHSLVKVRTDLYNSYCVLLTANFMQNLPVAI